jgi:hypothetical protein
MTHDELRKKTLIEANKIQGVKLWPNPIGLGFVGKVARRFSKNGKNYTVLENARPVKFGLAKGSSDLIGFTEVKIGEIVLPRFLGVEIKVGKDKLREEQRNFMNMVNSYGGCAGVVKDSVDTLVDLLGMPLKVGN